VKTAVRVLATVKKNDQTKTIMSCRFTTPLAEWFFFLSQKEIQLILAKAQEPHRTWYGLAAETGLRAGELCGLTVDDIDIERGMLQVRQSAWRGKLGDPKTDDSTRVVELSPQACAHLRTFLKSWHPNERRLLFASRNGTPWDQNLLLKRKFKPLLRALGIQVPHGNGFHAFRHANATLMNSFGASQKLRQQRLGHADGSHPRDQRGWKADRGATWQRGFGEFWTLVGP
jgi:integrase